MRALWAKLLREEKKETVAAEEASERLAHNADKKQANQQKELVPCESASMLNGVGKILSTKIV